MLPFFYQKAPFRSRAGVGIGLTARRRWDMVEESPGNLVRDFGKRKPGTAFGVLRP